MTLITVPQLPLLTSDLPGTGGRIKQEVEDFQVDEIPLDEPWGEGPYRWLWLEKTGVSADKLLERVAAMLGVQRQAIGCAGLKDTRAVTRQWLSVPANAEARLDALDGQGLRLLRVVAHHSALHTGELAGNRFRVVLRGVEHEAAARATAVLERLGAKGLPNYFGPQRFGRSGETLTAGLAMLRGDDEPLTRASGSRGRFLQRLALNAAQSALFNHYVGARLRDGTLYTVLDGDVLQRVAVSSEYLARVPAREQERYDQRRVVPAGPMFGPRMRPAAGVVEALEAETLTAADLTSSQFASYAKLAPGTRRPVVVWLDQVSVEAGEGTLTLSFSLPAGSYATVLLRELTKGDDHG